LAPSRTPSTVTARSWIVPRTLTSARSSRLMARSVRKSFALDGSLPARPIDPKPVTHLAVEVGPAREHHGHLVTSRREVVGNDLTVLDRDVAPNRAHSTLRGLIRQLAQLSEQRDPSSSIGSSVTLPWPTTDRRNAAREAPSPLRLEVERQLAVDARRGAGEDRHEIRKRGHPLPQRHVAEPDLPLEARSWPERSTWAASWNVPPLSVPSQLGEARKPPLARPSPLDARELQPRPGRLVDNQHRRLVEPKRQPRRLVSPVGLGTLGRLAIGTSLEKIGEFQGSIASSEDADEETVNVDLGGVDLAEQELQHADVDRRLFNLEPGVITRARRADIQVAEGDAPEHADADRSEGDGAAARLA